MEQLWLYFVIFCCFLNFSFQKHLIMMLLSLELILICMFTLLVMKLWLLLSLMMVSLGACEGALGLSLLVGASNNKNKYFVNSFFLSKC